MRLAKQKKEEEDRIRTEEIEKKAKEAEEKRKRLEEAEKKRQAMVSTQKEKQEARGMVVEHKVTSRSLSGSYDFDRHRLSTLEDIRKSQRPKHNSRKKRKYAWV